MRKIAIGVGILCIGGALRAEPFAPPGVIAVETVIETPPEAGKEGEGATEKSSRAKVIATERPREKPLCILKDGSRVVGDISVAAFKLKTSYGMLDVPVADTLEVRFGRVSDPGLKARLDGLIRELGAAEIGRREAAVRELEAVGPWAIPDLEHASRSEDLEVRSRAHEVLERLEGLAESGEYYGVPDEVVTREFTARGDLQLDAIEVKTSYGPLKIQAKDVRRLLVGAASGFSRTIEITGAQTHAAEWGATGIRVTRGDRLKIAAAGSLFVQNWGAAITPDGNGQWGNHIPGIPCGALVGKIGKNGPLFLVGSGLDRKADRDGDLYLACGINNPGVTTGSFEAKIEVTKD